MEARFEPAIHGEYWPILRDGEFDEFVIGMAA
jgi:hypothetical protein